MPAARSPDAPIRIRRAARSDLEAWSAMRCALWPETGPDQLRAECAAFFAGQDGIADAVLIAEAPAGPVGMAEVALRGYAEGCDSRPVGYLEAWYVEPGYRHRGVGRALVEAALAWARERGCTEFASDTEAENAGSAAAHRALGFEEVCLIRCFRKPILPSPP